MLLVLFQNGKLEHLIQKTYLLEGAERYQLESE